MAQVSQIEVGDAGGGDEVVASSFLMDSTNKITWVEEVGCHAWPRSVTAIDITTSHFCPTVRTSLMLLWWVMLVQDDSNIRLTSELSLEISFEKPHWLLAPNSLVSDP